ncbi:hypothetical protein [Nonlabens sp.]
MEQESTPQKNSDSKRWNKWYIIVIAANLMFAVIFYIITAVYGTH